MLPASLRYTMSQSSDSSQPQGGQSQAPATPHFSGQVQNPSHTNPLQPPASTGLLPNPVQVSAPSNKLPKDATPLPNFRGEVSDLSSIIVSLKN
jgi:hypothetical protein